jgi:hypothetical protein
MKQRIFWNLRRWQGPFLRNIKSIEALAALEQSIHTALGTYSNVHRGSGHNSLATTYLYEQAREIVLEYLGLDKAQYTTISDCIVRSSKVKPLMWLPMRIFVGFTRPRNPVLGQHGKYRICESAGRRRSD